LFPGPGLRIARQWSRLVFYEKGKNIGSRGGALIDIGDVFFFQEVRKLAIRSALDASDEVDSATTAMWRIV
jgi:hypothetical protein